MKFTPRMTKPEAGNKYYIRKGNGGYSNAIAGYPVDKDCDVLSNCVGYAYGRFNEIGGYGFCKYLAPVNAENFITYKGSCQTGMTPKLGACMVWQCGATLSGSDGAGHVAIVEQVISETEVITSESGYGCATPFWTQTRRRGSGNWGAGSAYKFLGFIYNPAVPDTAKPEENALTRTETTSSATLKYEDIIVGSIVKFNGDTHYTTSSATYGKRVNASAAKVTAKYKAGKHTIHLRAVDDNGRFIDGVYGWVDISDISPLATTGKIKANSVVRVKEGAVTTTGVRLASFVYKRNHKVLRIDDEGAVITYGGVVVAKVRLSDLILIA